MLESIYDELSLNVVPIQGHDYGITVRFYRHCGDGWNRALSASLEKRGTQSGTQDESQAAAPEKLIKLIMENKKATRNNCNSEVAFTLSINIFVFFGGLTASPAMRNVSTGVRSNTGSRENKKRLKRKYKEEKRMNTNMMELNFNERELNLDDMELVCGGKKWKI